MEMRPPSTPAARQTWRNSLRARLMLWSALSQMALCMLLLVLFYLAARELILRNAQDEARGLALQTARSLGEVLGSVQVSGRILEHSGAAIGRQPFNLRALLRATVIGGGNVSGAMLVLEDDALGPGTRGFTWYLRGGPAQLQELSEQDLGYDPQARDWYRRTVASGRAWWSEPRRSADGVQDDVATYHLPLQRPGDRDGAAPVGVISVELPVERLREVLRGLPVEAGVQALLLSPGHQVVVHVHTRAGAEQPGAEPAGVEPRPLAALVVDRPDLAALQQPLQGSGPQVFDHRDSDLNLYTVAMPVHDSGWTLALTISRDYVLARLNRVAAWLLLAALVGTVLAWRLGRRISRNMAGPIEDLSGSAQGFKRGQFEAPLPHTDRQDEVGVLARALDSARHSIRGQLEEIEALALERQRVDSELSIAREIQDAMLPVGRVFEGHHARVEVGARLEPAQLVGGDFYQFSEMHPGVVWFAVGDVSDKGLPAALFMARATSVLEVAARGQVPPDQVLATAGRRLAENNDPCMFATVLCGRLDVETGEYVLASAGHEPPLLLRADGSVHVLALESGPVLGIEPGLRFPLSRGTLARGDTLVAFTDGVSEAFDMDNRALGHDGVGCRLQAGLSAQAQCDHVLACVREHAGQAPQSDDITVLAIRLPQADSTHAPPPP